MILGNPQLQIAPFRWHQLAPSVRLPQLALFEATSRQLAALQMVHGFFVDKKKGAGLGIRWLHSKRGMDQFYMDFLRWTFFNMIFFKMDFLIWTFLIWIF